MDYKELEAAEKGLDQLEKELVEFDDGYRFAVKLTKDGEPTQEYWNRHSEAISAVQSIITDYSSKEVIEAHRNR